jgi:hypothetical protein
MGNCLTWNFFENNQVPQSFGRLFSIIKPRVKIDKKWFWQLFHKLIWSPCTLPSQVIKTSFWGRAKAE